MHAWVMAIKNLSSLTWVMFTIFSVSPLLLAYVVGQSLYHGRPLRFFLIGFFLYGLILTFVELPPRSDSQLSNGIGQSLT